MKSLDELDPNSTEYEETLRALQEAEDAETSDEPAAAEEEVKDDAAEEPKESEEPKDELKEEPAEEPKEPATKVAGVASKDGKHVLPFAVLKGAREEAAAARKAREAAEAKAAELERQIEDLKAGKKPEDDDFGDLSELASDFPVVEKLAEAVKSLREQVKTLKATPAQVEEEPSGNPVQDAIDSVPTLLEWQMADREKFARAVEHDKVLQTSPKWKDKPLEERFAEAARRTAEEFDEVIEEPETPKPTVKKTSLDEAVKTAPRKPPNTLSDFKASAPSEKTDDIRGLSPQKALNRFDRMTDAEIEAYLRKTGGD